MGIIIKNSVNNLGSPSFEMLSDKGVKQYKLCKVYSSYLNFANNLKFTPKKL